MAICDCIAYLRESKEVTYPIQSSLEPGQGPPPNKKGHVICPAEANIPARVTEKSGLNEWLMSQFTSRSHKGQQEGGIAFRAVTAHPTAG